MVAVNVTLLKTLYPAVIVQVPSQDPPITHLYSRILRDAERGVYTAPSPNSTDYLECVLPFLAYYPGVRNAAPGRLLAALPDLEKGALLNPDSVLAELFLGIVYERSGRLDEAFSQYSGVWELFPECFPAALGLAQIMEARGEVQESVRFLSDLVLLFPDNLQVKRQLAIAYYSSGDWSRAETAVAEILQKDSRDGEFILMRAHILAEMGQLLQAQAPLDIYAAINPNNKLYLFLRARVQAEVYHNRDAALNYLRSILRSSPSARTAGGETIDDTAAVYTARLLMGSPRPEDQTEGRNLLQRLLSNPAPSLVIAGLALDDAIRREDWPEARTYLARLLAERRSPDDLLAAYTMEKAQGNNAAALSYARELYERDRTNEEGIIAYISALIDTGRADEAARMLDTRLGSMGGGILKSRYFYLRSRTRGNEELAMNDLRSSLFEDPRNLEALIAMFEIYHRRSDERRAVYYLRQALALAPENPRLKRYELEYAAALANGF
jgi:tetratricopeptide (TPR) repeat protein